MQFSTVSANTIAVGNTATEIFDRRIRTLLYVNNKSAGDIWVGFWPEVTTVGEFVGFHVQAGQKFTIGMDKLGKRINEPVYAVALSAGLSADFIEV